MYNVSIHGCNTVHENSIDRLTSINRLKKGNVQVKMTKRRL